ncbi:MAG: hypothetical protein U0401_31875 [Anaerolineae bacterium]
MITPEIVSKSLKRQPRQQIKSALALLSLTGLATGCTTALAQSNQTEAQTLSDSTTAAVLPTLMPTPTPLTPNPTVLAAPTPTPWAAATPWPTPTPWPAPAAWRPALPILPTLAPMPVTPAAAVSPAGEAPIAYGPPNGVDVFGGTLLRWSYGGALAPDEFFDIRIKPYGSNNSAFVEWTKTPEYQLNPWSGWLPGLYTWQIGIIKGTLEGGTKHFIADTGRVSQPFLIKWQAGGGGGGGSSAPGGGGGGGGKSGGS